MHRRNIFYRLVVVVIMKSELFINILACLHLSYDTVNSQKVPHTPLSTTLNVTRHGRQSRQTKEFSCTLPDYPDNGKWIILNGKGEPGETIPINSVIQYQCRNGYKLSSENMYVVCDANWNSSKNSRECERSCSPMSSSSTTTLKCVDKVGKEISCQDASEGTYLTYTCTPFYETPFGYKTSLLCLDGIWNYPKPVCQPVCGRKVVDGTTPLIFGGEVKKVIEHPWITALYEKINNKYVNVCGGSIISARVVLTAAHCVTNDGGEPLSKEKFLVAAGKLYNNYMDPRDPEPQYLEIFRIVVHPSYRGDSRRYLGDIALLVTQKPFVLSNFVQPVCFNDVNNVHLHAGNIGAVSGWGVKEGGLSSDELRTLEIPYKYETTCAQELPLDWANKYNIIDKICAGFFNGSMSVCKGDSGNGLAFKNPENNRYYIHGTVSIGPSINGECNIQQNSLYTKVAFYYEFIDKEIAKYSVDESLLPPYPNDGKWSIANEETVSGHTIVEVTCDEGFKSSAASQRIECESLSKMPTCQYCNATINTMLRMVSRLEWVAQPPVEPLTPLKSPVPLVIIHHTATENCTSAAQCIPYVRYIQQLDVESNHWLDIGYNFLIGGDGVVYEGRGWTSEGAHTIGYNFRSIGVAFIGTFQFQKPPMNQIVAFMKLCEKGVELGYIQKDYKILTARQLYATENPGKEFYKEIQTWSHWSNEP